MLYSTLTKFLNKMTRITSVHDNRMNNLLLALNHANRVDSTSCRGPDIETCLGLYGLIMVTEPRSSGNVSIRHGMLFQPPTLNNMQSKPTEYDWNTCSVTQNSY